jgi:hypothetical protein
VGAAQALISDEFMTALGERGAQPGECDSSGNVRSAADIQKATWVLQDGVGA